MSTKNILLFLVFVTISININAQAKKKIEIINSKTLEATEILGPDIKVLIGDVILKHDSAYMYCDSAYYNTKANYFTAFGNIHVISPTEDMVDTVNLYGDSLTYYGSKKMAHVRNNVILEKDSMTLYTENLDYDLKENIGYYFDGGRTLNGQDTLISKLGYYYANNDELFFKDSVIVQNPKYTIYSDTLKHHTKNKISFILGPTNIIASDSSNYIYSEHGWYDHKKDLAQFDKNPILVHSKQTIKGDKLFYDRKKRFGQSFDNVRITDTTQNTILLGNYGEYYELTEKSLLTDRAVFIQIQKGDSLFLHADTLLSIKDSLITKTDTTEFKLIKAYYKVKIYKSDFQAKCDSLIYTFLDSIIEMHVEPILWSGKNQLTADFIKILTENQEISKVFMDANALIVAQSDTINFDQIKGKDMIGYIKNNELNKIDVIENGELIYFAKEDESLIGVNKIKCKDMAIYLDSNEIDKIWFYKNPEGTLYPPKQLGIDELKFANFQWHSDCRPLTKEDIFIWRREDENAIKSETPEIKKSDSKKDKLKIENFNKKKDKKIITD
ncbi:MAG: hypothetical protein JXR51_15385 [Bacteroidales bacterium]|nr:hypothetical protein [Bacteroidales bacterium]MBN2758553.1 hypothetical protein [Bacteroidales bacterium]